MNFAWRRIALLVVLAMCGTTSAHAIPIQWQMTTYFACNVCQGNLVPLEASFIYDADTNTYSNISTTDGINYVFEHSNGWLVLIGVDPEEINPEVITDFIPAQVFSFDPLTNAGGILPARLVYFGSCVFYQGSCIAQGYSFRVPAQAGSVQSVIPIPSAVWLFGSALSVIGWMRRKTTCICD